MDDLKERRGYSHLKEEALDRTMWRARFGRDFGPVVRQTTKWMNKYINIYIYIYTYTQNDWSRDIVVSVSTRCRLDSSVFETQWGKNILVSIPVQTSHWAAMGTSVLCLG